MTTKQQKAVIKLAYIQNKSSVLRWRTMGLTEPVIEKLIMGRVQAMIKKTNWELRMCNATIIAEREETVQLEW